MSAIDDIHAEFDALQIRAAFTAHRKRQREIARRVGYAEYDTWTARLVRFKKKIRRQQYLSRIEWQKLVDEVVDQI